MLVLWRKIGESFHIGDDVLVKVLGVERDYRVMVGIEAPRSMAVDRAERREEQKRERASWRKSWEEIQSKGVKR